MVKNTGHLYDVYTYFMMHSCVKSCFVYMGILYTAGSNITLES